MSHARAGAAEIAAFTAQAPSWQFDARTDALHRRYEFADFREAFAFMTAVAAAAERRNHHPEWSNVYNGVEIRLTTHDSGGVTAADLELAREIDTLASSTRPAAHRRNGRIADRLDLAGRRIVITGGLGVVGSALAAALHERGSRVVLIDRAAWSGGDAGATAPGTRILDGIDLTRLDAARAAFDEAAAALDGLDALVNVAGGFLWQSFLHPDVDDWARMFSLNLATAVTASRAALPHLLRQDRSSVVNVGALSASNAGPGLGAYAAAKAGIEKLTQALAAEFGPRGLRVNAVLPGVIDTPQNRRDMPSSDVTKWVHPAELAEVVAFLISDAASAITGASLPVAGRP
jgi:NAD(P)-dependent dehydrogenase (short-subunit alcohol dehydrogenase family)/pterin-4a-carbinolamine dehydratase